MTKLLKISREEFGRAVRSCRRNPFFTICVLTLLAVTIGAMTALGAAAYELVNGPLPYGAADRLVMIWSDRPKTGYVRAPFSPPEIVDLRARNRTLSGIAAISPGTTTLDGPQGPTQIPTVSVTSNFFEVVRATPLIGRTFGSIDDMPGAMWTLILSWEAWQNRFGGDRSVVGRRIRLGNDPIEIVGVMAPSFRMAFPPDAGIETRPEAYIVMASGELPTLPRFLYSLRVVARLRDGASFAAASADLGTIGAALEREFAGYATTGRRFYAVDLAGDLAEPVRLPAAALAFAGLFLVLVGYANLTGLWIARSVAQRQEHGIQQALGASTARLRGQLVIHGALLSAAGSVVGLAAGAAGLIVLRAVRPPSLARVDYATLSWPLILAVLAVVCVSTLVLIAVPQAGVASLAESGLIRATGTAAPRYRLRSALVIAQVAFVLVFLVCSALWTRSLVNAMHTDLGFQPESVLTFKYAHPPGTNKPDARTLFNRRISEAIAALPGVSAAGIISHVPFDAVPNRAVSYRVDGRPEGSDKDADTRMVGPGFLRAIGGRLREGRFFVESDDLNAPAVVVVDRLLAERTWPGEPAIGKRLRLPSFPGGSAPTAMTVIGVIDHIRYYAVESERREQIYLAVAQAARGPYAMLVRASGDLTPLMTAIRSRARQVDPATAVWDVRTLQDYYDEAAAERRFTAMLLVSFAVAALIVASIGVYGLLAYIVANRRNELGVRIALGAGGPAVARGIVRESLQWAVAGVGIGALLLVPGSAALSSALYGVTAYDPVSWGAAAGLLLVVVAVASWVPAFRASRIDPSALMKSA